MILCLLLTEQKNVGQQALPENHRWGGERLYQKPVRELETMRHNKVEYKDVAVSETVKLEGIRGSRFLNRSKLPRPLSVTVTG